jgi:hypothetical protein
MCARNFTPAKKKAENRRNGRLIEAGDVMDDPGVSGSENASVEGRSVRRPNAKGGEPQPAPLQIDHS